MKTVQRIAKNTSVFLIAQIISSVLTFFFFAYTSRYLGPESFGILSFAIALTAIFSILNDLGLGQVTIREIARDKSLTSKYIGNIAAIKIILSIITFGLIALTINLLGYPKQTIEVVYLLGLSVSCRAFIGMFNSISQAHEKMEYNSIGQILNSSLMLIGVLFVISKRFNIVGFAFIYFVVSAISLVYYFTICAWKFAKPKIEIDWSFWKSTIKESLPFGLVGIFTMILHLIDTVMLSLMQGNTVTGWYSAAYRAFFVLLLIPSALNVAIFPIMSYYHISSKDSLKFIYEKSFKYLTIIAIPIGIGGTLLAGKIILLVFGKGYQPSIIAFQILIWSAVLIFIGTPGANLFNSTNRQTMLTKIVGISTVLNVFLNLLLIPKYSYIGAGIATVVSMLLISFAIIIGTAKIGYKMPVSGIIKLILKAIFSSLIMGIFVAYFIDINLFLLIMFSAIIYFIMMYFFKGFDEEDLDIVKKIVKFRQKQ